MTVFETQPNKSSAGSLQQVAYSVGRLQLVGTPYCDHLLSNLENHARRQEVGVSGGSDFSPELSRPGPMVCVRWPIIQVYDPSSTVGRRLIGYNIHRGSLESRNTTVPSLFPCIITPLPTPTTSRPCRHFACTKLESFGSCSCWRPAMFAFSSRCVITTKCKLQAASRRRILSFHWNFLLELSPPPTRL